MTPVFQSRFSDHPAGGNCFAACLASILDVEIAAVPAPTVDDRETEGTWLDYWRRVADFLAGHGLTVLQVTGEAMVWTPSALATTECAGAVYVAGGPGPRGVDHSVVMTEGDVLVHDPHPDGGGLLEVRDRSYLVATTSAGAATGVVRMGVADLETAARWLGVLRSKAGEMQAREIQNRTDAILDALKRQPLGPPGAISASTDAAWTQGHVEGPDGEKLSGRYAIRWIHEPTGQLGCVADDAGEPIDIRDKPYKFGRGPDGITPAETVVTVPGARYVPAEPWGERAGVFVDKMEAVLDGLDKLAGDAPAEHVEEAA